MSDEILQNLGVREYGPDLEELGFGTSWLQEIPYLANDRWGGHFREVGINPHLRKAWLRRYDEKGWLKALDTTFRKPYEKVINEYERQGVTSERTRFHTIQLDAAYLDGMLLDNDFRESFLSTLYRAREDGMVVNIFVNQFAGIQKGQEDFAASRFVELKGQLLDFLHENNLNGDNKDIIIESIPERDKSFWCDYVDKIAELGGNAFRFSCEWSRIINPDGSVNEGELDDLAEIVGYARSRDVDVSLCLNHFTMPDWIKDGWLNPDIAGLFGDYAKVVFDGLENRGALPKRFLTLNEAMSVLSAGYLEGTWYPYESMTSTNFTKQFPRYSKAIENTRKSHIEAYSRIKKREEDTGKKVEVGFTHNMAWFSPYMRFSPIDYAWSVIGANLSESWIKDMLGKDWEEYGDLPTDFVAVQFYNEHTIGPFNGSAGSTTSLRDLIDGANRFINGWKRYPEGMMIQLLRVNSMILRTAARLGSTKLPGIMISEFGVPGLVDPRDEIKVLSDAINIGKKLSNLEYSAAIVWTLLNNFELGEGYFVHFGHYDHNGNGKEHSAVEPKGLNLRDPNIRIAIEEYRYQLKSYARRLRKDETLDIEEKTLQLATADAKLKAIGNFLTEIKK